MWLHWLTGLLLLVLNYIYVCLIPLSISFTSPITPRSDKYLASVKYFISKLKLRGNQCVSLILSGVSRALLGI